MEKIDLTLNEEFYPDIPSDNSYIRIFGLTNKWIRLDNIMSKRFGILDEFTLINGIDPNIHFHIFYNKLFGIYPKNYDPDADHLEDETCHCCGQILTPLNRIYSLCEICDQTSFHNEAIFNI